MVRFLVFSLLFTACSTGEKNSNQPFGNCPLGPPQAIFKPDLPSVKSHQFTLETKSAIEKVAFDNGIYLELIQSGCEKPKQEFQFTLPTSTKHFQDADWLSSGLDLLGYMGNLSPDLQPFLMWENALTNKLPDLKIGLPHELEKGFFVKMDKVSGEESGLLILTLYQE